MPHSSPSMSVVRPLIGALVFAGCALFAIPLHAAPVTPARPPAVQQRIEQQRTFQRVQQGDLSALRDLSRARAEQRHPGRAQSSGRSLAARVGPSRVGRDQTVQGGGPPVAIYVAFDDGRAIGEGYLAKFDAAGLPAPGWPAFGLNVIAGAQVAFEHQSIDDGAGGRIVGWSEYGIGTARLHAQRINDAGVRQWGPTGVMVTPNDDASYLWEMIPDGAGGAFFAWEATATDSQFIRVQHVNSAGTVAAGWPADGVRLGAWGTISYSPQLARDGIGGVYVGWFDGYSGLAYAQHLDASAAPQFSPAEGRPYSFLPQNYSISPDASYGLLLTWTVGTVDGTSDVLAERLDTAGISTWGDSGIVVCDDPMDQWYPRIQPDGGGGVLIGWIDFREGPSAVYAQRLESNGVPVIGWPANGARVGVIDPYMEVGWIPDGLGGAFFDLPNLDLGLGYWQHSVQHLLADGGIANNYGPDGLIVASLTFDPSIHLFLDGSGGVLSAWFQPEAGGIEVGDALFGQHIDIGGSLLWGNGSPMQLSPSSVGRQGEPFLVEGGSGGARVGFGQFNGATEGLDAGIKRVNQNGAPQGSTIPVAYGPGNAASLALVGDSGNRTIALWTDQPGKAPRLLARRFSNTGVPLWPGDVEITANTIFGTFGQPKIPAVTDGANGAIAVWTTNDVLAQRIDSTGTMLWGAAGVSVFTAPHGSIVYSDRDVHPAGANGAFVAGLVFDESPPGVPMTRWAVQKLDGNGNRLWGATGSQFASDSLGIFNVFGSAMVPDGQGGAYAAWQIGLFPEDLIKSIRIVRFQASGARAPGWPVEGIEVRSNFFSGALTGLATDGLGNAVVTWMEFRGGRIGSYAQLVNASGGLQWNGPGPGDAIHGVANEGVALALDSGAQVFPLVDTDGAGGAVFAWLDGRGSSWDVYAQRITSDGARAWGSAGLGVCTATAPQGNLALVSDGASGALIAWADGRTMPADLIQIARVTGAGALPWTSDGVVSTLASLHSAQVVDGVARLAWTTSDAQFRARLERRTLSSEWQTLSEVRVDGTGWIRAEDATVERGARYGYRLVATSGGIEQPLGEVWLDVPNALEFALRGMRPNPANGPLTVSFVLPGNAPARLEVIDIAGRRVLSREVGSLGAGSHVLNLGEPSGMGPGLYFLRLSQGTDRREVRFTRVR